MSDMYAMPMDQFVIELPVDTRLAFIRKVYSLFLVSLLATIAVTVSVLSVPIAADIAGRYWYVWVGLYFLLSWFGEAIAAQGKTVGYIVLSVLSVVTGLAFGPTIRFYIGNQGVDIVYQALGLTTAIFGGLTAGVFITKQDFSFLRGFLWMGVLALIGVGVLGIFINFDFGMQQAITIGGVLLFVGFILYDTSNILHHYREEQVAAAAAAIYLDFVILFMKLLRLLRGRD